MKKFLIPLAVCAAISSTIAYAEPEMELLVVTGSRVPQALDQTVTDTVVLDEKEIRNSGATDVPTLLKKLAGFEFTQSGGMGQQGSLFLRGSNSNQVLVLVDGVRVGSATTGDTAIAQLMLDQIERIEVVRGNVSSLYGSEAIGGVVQIFTRTGKGEPSFNISAGAGSYQTRRATAGFGGKVENTSFNVQLSKYRTDGFSAINPAVVPSVNPDKDGYENGSLGANVAHNIDADNKITASVLNSRGNVEYDNAWGAAADDNVSKSAIRKFALASENHLSTAWRSKVQWSQGSDEYRGYLNETETSHLKTINRQLSWQNTLSVGSAGNVVLGAERLTQHVDSNTAYTQTERKVNSAFAGYTGNYGVHQVQANVRRDRYPDFGIARTGLLGYGYALTDAWRVTATASTAFKAPTFNDLFAPIAWGSNPDLRPERSRNAEVGLHYAVNQKRFDLVYFDNRIRDLIVADSFWVMQNLKSARIRGAELSYVAQYGDTSVKAAMTLQNPRQLDTGSLLPKRARKFANLGGDQQWGRLTVGGEVHYSGYREESGKVLPAYSVVNAKARYTFNQKLDLLLQAENIFNKDYMLVHGYNTPGRTLFAGLNYRQ